MRTKVVVAGMVLTALLLFIALLFFVPHKPPQDITVRHVKSVQSSDDITTMTFEITNHSAIPYVFFPFEVQVRNGNIWTKFQGFDMRQIYTTPKIDPKGLTSYTVNVTNLPPKSVVRFSIRPQKILLGVNGLVRRAELNLKKQGRKPISLNPFDRNSRVFGLPTEVRSEEFVEAVK